jgi:Ser/Thr protein kinase RdoA (MazF antagonist)
MRRFDGLTDGERAERLLRVAQKALLAYGLSGDLSLAASATNTIFRLRASGLSCAVRICNAGRDRVPLQRELTWLAALGRDTTLSVPEPILTMTGDLSRSVSMEGVPGTRACAVLRWIGGDRREAELTTDEAASVGRFAAALHVHAESFRWPEELTPESVGPAERALAAAEALRGALVSADDRALLCDVVGLVAESTSALGDGPEAAGVIHGDLRLRKLRHDQGSVGAFGFDDCRIGAYLDDLSLLWSELADRETTPVLQEALLDGYRSVRALPGDPEDMLRGFTALRALECAAQAAPVAPASRPSREAETREVPVIQQEFASLRALLRRERGHGAA